MDPELFGDDLADAQSDGAAGVPDRPTRQSYLALLTVFNFGVAGLVASRTAKRRFRSGIPWQDLFLLGVAAHKISRLVTTEPVTQPLREPFTRNASGQRVVGWRRAMGELVTCPYCTSSWLTLALSSAYAAVPVPTRVASGLFGVMALSDFLSRFYVLLRDKGRQARVASHA